MSLIQTEVGEGLSPSSRLRHIIDLLTEAPPADLYMLPEAWTVGYFAFDLYADHAEPLDGSAISALRQFAVDRGAYVLAGSIIERRYGELYNTSALMDDQGELIAVYRKIHLFGYESRESELITPGRSLAIADTPFGRVGIATCYDLRFPEQFRAMAWQGVEIFLVPSAWPESRARDWELLTTVRAMENQALLIGCNAAGEQGGVRLAGRSRVIDPRGDAIGEAGAAPETLAVDVDPTIVEQCRGEFPSLSDSNEFRFEM